MKTHNFIIPFIIAIVLFSISCDVLEQTPESDITQANFWKTPKDAETGLIAVYSLFMNSAYRAFELGEVRSDNVEMPPKWGYEMINPPLMDFNRNIIASNDGYSTWVTFYNIIARANEVIYYTDKIEFLVIADKERIIGEALFLKAYAYFVLAKNWGAVPLIVEPFFTQGENMYVERTPVDLVYDQIIKDLTLAEQYLPTNRSDLRIRASKAAAQALFCDVLLTRGYTSFAQANDFATAVTKADAVIANTNYKLESGTKFEDIFRKPNNVETIFAVWFDYKNSATHNLSNFFLPRAYNKNRPYGGESLMLPSHSLVDSFEPGDLRAATTFTVLAPNEEIYYDANVKGMTYGNKYLGTVVQVGVQRYSDNHIIKYRLPDVMLMKAEALAKTNQVTQAVNIINQIRDRAGLLPKSASNASEALDLVLSERKKELAFEGKRWYDLVRTGKINEFRTEPEFIKGRVLLAVPQVEVDRNQKLLPQNPTY
jgi:starch-binding outer membrane protein, SusD/RagB family